MPCKSCAGGRRLRCAGPHLRAVRRRFWPRVRSAPGGRGSCAGRCFCRTPRRLRPSPGQRMLPGRLQAPKAGPPPHARAHGDALPGPDSCGDAHAGALPRFHAAAQCRAGAGRRGPHPQRDAQAGQRRRLCGTGRRQHRNSTEHTDADLRAAVTTQNLPFAVEKNSTLPQVLIMHTHATESYQTWPDPCLTPATRPAAKARR